jgi:uncharacterized membrane protein
VTRLLRLSWAHLALITGIAHFLLTASIGLSRHWAYLTSVNDLGIFDQAIWGIMNGAPYLNTINPFGMPINWLGYHFNPILFVFVPFYLVYPAAEWLIIFQAAAISITAWPLYLIAKRVIQSERAAFLWAVAYLVNPFVLSAAVWDFHPVALAAPFMALGVLAIDKREAWLFGLACLFLLLIQEHFGIAVAGFGVLWWLRNRSLTPAVIAFCVGVAHTVFVLGVIMPALSPTGRHLMISGGLGYLSRYAWLGDSASQVAQNAIEHPFFVLETVFVNFDGGRYLAFLLLPFLGLPLAGIEFLIPGLADLLANMLSANAMPRSVVAYHSISLLPLLVIAGIYGSERLMKKLRFSTLGLGGMIVWVSFLFGYLFAPLSLPYALNIWRAANWPYKPEKAVSEVNHLLPPDTSISVQGNVGAHFSERHYVYVFPAKVGEVGAVVLRLANPTMREAGENPAMIGSLGQHLMMSPDEFLDAVQDTLDSKVYGVVYWKPPWLVLSKTAMKEPEAMQAAGLYLKQLRREWNTEEHTNASSPR